MFSFAGTIELNWYNDDETPMTVPSNSTSCNYGDQISLPPNPTKPGYTFKGRQIFSGMTTIEYLQNNGVNTQRIDTGIPGDNDNYNISIDFMVLNLDTTKTWHTLFGNNIDEQHNLWRILFSNHPYILFYTNTRSNTSALSVPFILNQKYSIDFNYNQAVINGTPRTIPNHPIGQANNTTIKLFWGTATDTYRIYHFAISDNNVLILDMIPVKDLDGTPCMYDRVSGQFFYNTGTGDYIAGPEI